MELDIMELIINNMPSQTENQKLTLSECAKRKQEHEKDS